MEAEGQLLADVLQGIAQFRSHRYSRKVRPLSGVALLGRGGGEGHSIGIVALLVVVDVVGGEAAAQLGCIAVQRHVMNTGMVCT